MPRMPYMDEPWFVLLHDACEKSSRTDLAKRLGVAQPTVCQVLNGSGLYGTGQASPARLAEKVVHLLGQYVCPHLSEQHGESRVISADECRVYAHRNPPIGSPRDLAHWQACRRCPHFALSAPAGERVVKPRKRDAQAEPSIPNPTTPKETEACSATENT